MDNQSLTETSNKMSPLPVRIFQGFNAFLNAVGSLWIFFLMVLINIDIFGRYLFSKPLHGTLEITEMSIVGIIFLQLAHSLKAGKFTRSDGVYNFMLRRVPWLGNLFGVIFNLGGAFLAYIIMTGTWPKFIEAYQEKYYFGNFGVFTVISWPVKLIVVVGSFMLMVQFLLFAWQNIMAIVKPNNDIQDETKVVAS